MKNEKKNSKEFVIENESQNIPFDKRKHQERFNFSQFKFSDALI